MMCFGGRGLGCPHCVASSATPAATKTCENAEGQIVDLHGSTAICISATILLFLLAYSLLITLYNTELACHISINLTSRSLLNHSAIIVDCKGHGRRAHHKSYARRLASCYNKRCVRAYIGNKSFWTRVHWQQKSGRFNFRIGQTFVVLVWVHMHEAPIASLTLR